MIYVSLIFLVMAAFGLSFLSALALRKIAPHLGLIDESGRETRKDHKGKPALVGGMAIVFSIVLISLIWFTGSMDNIIPLIWGMGLYVLLGVFDDAINIPALSKLTLQIFISASVIIFFDFAIYNLGHLKGDEIFSLGDLAPLFTLLCILAYINAFNMVDGIDGLSGGIALSSFLFLGAIAYMADIILMQDIILIMSMATLGFLPLNMRSPYRRKAIVFLGDGGSLSISFAIAFCAISLGNEYSANVNLPSPIIYAFILAYPVFDMLVVMARRFGEGRSIFVPDTRHFHHILKNQNMPHGKVTMILIGLSVAYGLIGITLWQASVAQNICLGIWVLLLGFHFGMTKMAMSKTPQ